MKKKKSYSKQVNKKQIPLEASEQILMSQIIQMLLCVCVYKCCYVFVCTDVVILFSLSVALLVYSYLQRKISLGPKVAAIDT